MLRFAPTELTEGERALQREVREFLATELPPGSFTPGLGMAAERDVAFSHKLAARGWLGMALPREHGGQDRTAVDRFIVTEELLRWGAPVRHHWVADRQTGPVIARFGTAAQKARFLPAICAGEVAFSIGMSEPEAGSDLAAVQTRATRADGGWRISGTKVWTGGAHENDWFVVLCRTSDEDTRHQGLSQMIVDLRSPGLTVTPIPYMDGSHFFNEVVLDGVFVPDDLVLGEIGSGWEQNMNELAFERAGPERWLSPYRLAEEHLAHHPEPSPAAARVLGWAAANWWGIRALSLSVARLIDAGQAPAAESALVKELGTRFEQDVVDAFWHLHGAPGDTPYGRLLQACLVSAPSWTIRGGTNEVLRTVAARALRPTEVGPEADPLEQICALTIRHAHERRQFGQPLARFQAVQQHLVTIAQETALATVAAQAARDPFTIKAAQVLRNRAILRVTRAAHQVHGAVGTTAAHPLGRLTQALWAQRTNDDDLREELGRGLTAETLYPTITR